MHTAEIENLSYAELKSRRDELVEAVKDNGDLAARFVKARTDAKMRDEKLAEQAETIKALREGIAAVTEMRDVARKGHASAQQAVTDLRQRVADVESAAKAREEELVNSHNSALGMVGVNLQGARERLAAETARADRLKHVAARNQNALTSAAKLLNDAISAQHIDDAAE